MIFLINLSSKQKRIGMMVLGILIACSYFFNSQTYIFKLTES